MNMDPDKVSSPCGILPRFYPSDNFLSLENTKTLLKTNITSYGIWSNSTRYQFKNPNKSSGIVAWMSVETERFSSWMVISIEAGLRERQIKAMGCDSGRSRQRTITSGRSLQFAQSNQLRRRTVQGYKNRDRNFRRHFLHDQNLRSGCPPRDSRHCHADRRRLRHQGNAKPKEKVREVRKTYSYLYSCFNTKGYWISSDCS